MTDSTSCKLLNPRCEYSLQAILTQHDDTNLMMPPNSWVLWIDTDRNKGHLYRLTETGTKKLGACYQTYDAKSQEDKTEGETEIEKSFGYFFTSSIIEDIKAAFQFFIDFLHAYNPLNTLINKEDLLQTIRLYQDIYIEKKTA